MRTRIAFCLLLPFAPAAFACSFAFVDMPYDREHYVFYGKVLEHISHRMEACGRNPRPAGEPCPPAWGWRIQIIKPVNLPKPIEQTEYFEYTVDSACGAMPLGKEHVSRVPVGSLVAVIAAPHWSSDPTKPPRLSSVLPAQGTLAVLPPASDLAALANTEPDRRELACLPDWRWPEARLVFEYWRDRKALDREKSERLRMERLVRVMSVFDERFFPQGLEPPNMHGQVVRQYLTTPALLDEFRARLPAARSAVHAACDRK